MKRFPELARRGVALALAASMSLSVFVPGALAADLTTADVHDHDHVQLAAENSVDELGNEDLSDETFNVPEETVTAGDTAKEEASAEAADEDAGVADDLTEEQLAEQAVVDESGHEEHTPDTDNPVFEQPSTCTERGYAIYPCSFELEQEDGTVAHCYHQVIVWLPLADHEWGEWQEETDVDGSVVRYRVCSVCNAVEYEDGTIVTPGGIAITNPDNPEWLPDDIGMGGNYDDQIVSQSVTHKGACSFPNDGSRVLHWYKYPTCTEWGDALVGCSIWYDWGWSKGYCAGTKDHQSIKPYGHSWGAWTTVSEATCGTDGLKKRVCGRDGSHVETQTIPATGNHDWGEWTTAEATCTAPGKKYRTCKICQKEEVDDTYAAAHPATGHHTGGDTDEYKWVKGDGSDIGWVVTQPHKCVDGTKTRTCDACDETETLPVKASEDHKWVKDETRSIEPICTKEGIYYYTCSECGSEKSETIPANGHSDPEKSEWVVIQKPTCTANGIRVKYCTVCDAEIARDTTEGKEIKALGHEWDKGTIDQEYPCVDGTITYKCTRDGCDATKTETYKATEDHKYEFVSTTQKYPCTAGKETWKCSVCGATEERDAKVADHVWGEYEDDPVLGCAPTSQHTESQYCTVCGVKNTASTRPNGKTQQSHRFTHYVLITEVPTNKWEVWNYKLIATAQCDNVLYNRDGSPALDANGNQIRCGEVDRTALAGNVDTTELIKKPGATMVSEAVAAAAMPIIRDTLNDVKSAVNNASSREDAINALDELYNAAVANLQKGNRDDGEFHAELKYNLVGKDQYYDAHVKITKEMAENMLKPLKDVMDNVKEMLNNSFLTEDAIKQMVDKLMDTVLEDPNMKKVEDSIADLAFSEVYTALGGTHSKNNTETLQKTVTGSLILKLAQTAVDDDSYWQSFLDAIFDDMVDMLIEELKKDPEYSKYLDNALGDELLEELRPKLREELVKDDTFVKTIRGVASDAIQNAAARVNAGWSDDQILDKLREDLMKVQDPVEQEMLDLSATIGDLVESSLAEKINKFLPFGDLTSWIGKWVGAFAKDKAVSEVVGETGKVRSTIEMYIKYITCGQHHHVYENIAATCTEPAYTIDSCDKCGWRFSKTKTGEALGHTPVTVKGYDATETTDGLTDGIKCSVCGKWIEPQEVIPAQEPQYDKWLVKAAVTADTVKATGYKEQKKLDEAINAALTKAGYEPANSERFLAQVQTSIGILSNDRYPEDGVTGMVKIPAGAAGKNCTFYAVQVLTADTHGYSAGDVVITPLTVTDEGISLKVPVQSVVAIAWKVNE